MTQDQYIIRRKLNLVELGEVLGNVSEACRKLSVSRQYYYDIKKTLKEEGVEGLLEKVRTKPKVANRVAPEIETRVLAYSLEFPTHGQVRTSNELKREGVIVSAGGIRGIWLRHGLERKSQRLKRLEQWAAETQGLLTEEQVKALELGRQEREAHGEIETWGRTPTTSAISRALAKSISRPASTPTRTSALPRFMTRKMPLRQPTFLTTKFHRSSMSTAWHCLGRLPIVEQNIAASLKPIPISCIYT